MNNVEKIFNEKDMRELKELVSNFVNSINSDISIEFETQFTCSITEKHIYIGLLPLIQGFLSNDILEEIYKEKGIIYNDFYIFGLLHEIGHIETVKYLKYEDLSVELSIYQGQVAKLEEKYEYDRDFLNHYIELPLEKSANEWAVNYYNNNTEKVLEFTKDFHGKVKKILEIIRE